MRRRTVSLSLALFATLALPLIVTAQGDAPWRDIVSSRRLARRGAPHVTLELRSMEARNCLGRECTGPVEFRNVRGDLETTRISYFYSDDGEREPGCPIQHRDTLFAHWSEAEIAPARDEDRPACGLGITGEGGAIDDWVILRTRRLPEPATP